MSPVVQDDLTIWRNPSETFFLFGIWKTGPHARTVWRPHCISIWKCFNSIENWEYLTMLPFLKWPSTVSASCRAGPFQDCLASWGPRVPHSPSPVLSGLLCFEDKVEQNFPRSKFKRLNEGPSIFSSFFAELYDHHVQFCYSLSQKKNILSSKKNGLHVDSINWKVSFKPRWTRFVCVIHTRSMDDQETQT